MEQNKLEFSVCLGLSVICRRDCDRFVELHILTSAADKFGHNINVFALMQSVVFVDQQTSL
jgi:hypothetical protein